MGLVSLPMTVARNFAPAALAELADEGVNHDLRGSLNHSIGSVTETTATKNTVDGFKSGQLRSELSVKRAMSSGSNLAFIIDLLLQIEGLLKPMEYLVLKDCLANYPDIDEALQTAELRVLDSVDVIGIVLGDNCKQALYISFAQFQH